MIEPKYIRRVGAGILLALALGFTAWRIYSQLNVDLGAEFLPPAEEKTPVEEIRGTTAPLAQAVVAEVERPERDPFRYPPNQRSHRVVKKTPTLPTLQGIRGGDSPAAWLDGEFVRVGDEVGEWTISRIEKSRVCLVGPGGIERVVDAR